MKLIYLITCSLLGLSGGALGGGPPQVSELADVAERVRAQGFEVEELEVTTDDGYILGLQRLINPLYGQLEPREMKTVILLHGILTSSADWIMNVEPDLRPQKEANSTASSNSLAFHLANRGYNVLLANVRGNAYGLRHKQMTQEDRQFWSFSFDEQIAEDLPAILKFAQQHYAPPGGGQKVGFVGHSLGAKLMLGLLSDRPEFADQLEPVILLSPAASLANMRSPAKGFTQYTFLFDSIDMKFPGSAFARNYLADIECQDRPHTGPCNNLLFLVTGFQEQNLEAKLLDTYLAHVPQPTSVRSLCHLGQEVRSGSFSHFDFGYFGNLRRYHSVWAPAYDLAQIRSQSLCLFHANDDWISTGRDVGQLIGSLKVKPMEVFNMSSLDPQWSHLDFVYGNRAGELLNGRIERLLAAPFGPASPSGAH